MPFFGGDQEEFKYIYVQIDLSIRNLKSIISKKILMFSHGNAQRLELMFEVIALCMYRVFSGYIEI